MAAVNCMDGRVQIPVIEYMMKRYKADYVDMITQPGPAKTLSLIWKKFGQISVYRRLTLSVRRHQAAAIAIVAHHDCAGNPVPAERQHQDIARSLELIRSWDLGVPVIGLWVDENWRVQELDWAAIAAKR